MAVVFGSCDTVHWSNTTCSYFVRSLLLFVARILDLQAVRSYCTCCFVCFFRCVRITFVHNLLLAMHRLRFLWVHCAPDKELLKEFRISHDAITFWSAGVLLQEQDRFIFMLQCRSWMYLLWFPWPLCLLYTVHLLCGDWNRSNSARQKPPNQMNADFSIIFLTHLPPIPCAQAESLAHFLS